MVKSMVLGVVNIQRDYVIILTAWYAQIFDLSEKKNIWSYAIYLLTRSFRY